MIYKLRSTEALKRMDNIPASSNSHDFRCIISSVLLATSLLLSGCGGGGGGGGGGGNSESPAATAPTAVAMSFSTTKNTSVNGKLEAHDKDGDPLTYRIVNNGSRGSAVLTHPTPGAVTYTPNPGEEGNDSFDFKANDGSLDSNQATVTVAIINTPPVARDGNAKTNQDTVTGTLNLNASDSDGDTLSYSIVSNGTLGTAVITNAVSGAYTYTPNPGQFGSDTFTFSANDTTTTSNTATVTVAINGLPVAIGSCNTVKQGNQSPGLVGNLNASDDETPSMLTYSLLNPDGSDAGQTLTTSKGGTVTITDPTTGLFTYQADTRPGDKRGRDTFDYQVRDPDNAVASATEIVIVDQTVMPLGDSITHGTDCIGDTRADGRCFSDGYAPDEETAGYRQPLNESLIGSGYTFDFVGSLQHGSMASPPLDDDDHEGHRGWNAFEIAWGLDMNGSDGVFVWLEQNPADFILLHIGTNDLSSTNENNVAEILDEIDRWENSANANPVTVILARIIDWAPNNPEVDALNNAVEIMVNGRTNDNIVIVDQQTGARLNYTIGADMSDKVHPNTSGYGKMADVWFNGLAPLLDKCP